MKYSIIHGNNQIRSCKCEVTANYLHGDSPALPVTGIMVNITTFSDAGLLLTNGFLDLTFDESLHLAHRLLSLIGETGKKTGQTAQGESK